MYTYVVHIYDHNVHIHMYIYIHIIIETYCRQCRYIVDGCAGKWHRRHHLDHLHLRILRWEAFSSALSPGQASPFWWPGASSGQLFSLTLVSRMSGSNSLQWAPGAWGFTKSNLSSKTGKNSAHADPQRQYLVLPTSMSWAIRGLKPLGDLRFFSRATGSHFPQMTAHPYVIT